MPHFVQIRGREARYSSLVTGAAVCAYLEIQCKSSGGHFNTSDSKQAFSHGMLSLVNRYGFTFLRHRNTIIKILIYYNAKGGKMSRGICHRKRKQRLNCFLRFLISISQLVINYSIPHHRGKAYSINMYGFTKNSAKFPDST